MNQVEYAIEIIENQKDSWEPGSMTQAESNTVLNCLYRLRRILEIGARRMSESDESYD